MTEIPKSHPRYKSLVLRERLVDGFREGIVVPQGLIAHGRGEMFDYVLGERSVKEARVASKAAAALMMAAESPVISVNGNVAALCAEDVVRLSKETSAKIEVNLFHRTDERVSKIKKILEDNGADGVLGFLPDARIPGVDHLRSLVAREGIFSADVVLIPLEDGDRAEALSKMGKQTIAIDLNPISRTSRSATVTIVDEVTRAIPELVRNCEDLKEDSGAAKKAIVGYRKAENLASIMKIMRDNLSRPLPR